MPRRFPRTCPVCGRPNLMNISTHLLQVHGLPSKERHHLLDQAQVTSWQALCRFQHSCLSCTGPETGLHATGEKRSLKSRGTNSIPTKKLKAVATTSFSTKPYPEFHFRHKFSLLVVGPTQCGKTYFVQQILQNNRIVYEERRSMRILWCYNQWQDRYDVLRKSLGKCIQFERGLPELSEDLNEINPKYNNIIILDDLMAEATDSPVVARLFTQGRHRNASVILLLQNMFPKGKFNTDISRNAQYLALFRSPSDRKQIGIIGERMFDKNRGKFMSAYHRETSKPFGYLLVDNKPDTPADKQVLGDIFGSCKAYIFSTKTEENSNEESAPTSFSEARLERKQPKSHNHIIWSDAVIPVWQNYVSGAPAFRSIPEGYHIIEMYKTSRNSFDPRHPGIYVDGENYWPVKLRHHSTGGVKWIKLHENEPTVRAFVEETDKADNLISTSAQRG